MGIETFNFKFTQDSTLTFHIADENLEYLKKCKKQGYIIKKICNQALMEFFIKMEKNNLFIELED